MFLPLSDYRPDASIGVSPPRKNRNEKQSNKPLESDADRDKLLGSAEISLRVGTKGEET